MQFWTINLKYPKESISSVNLINRGPFRSKNEVISYLETIDCDSFEEITYKCFNVDLDTAFWLFLSENFNLVEKCHNKNMVHEATYKTTKI